MCNIKRALIPYVHSKGPDQVLQSDQGLINTFYSIPQFCKQAMRAECINVQGPFIQY